MNLSEIKTIQSKIKACRECPEMVGRPVHGSANLSSIFLLGQAPGPREESYGRPFAYTGGKTLFRWFEEAAGISEDHFRSHVYMAAVARCFPGKGSSGGDRIPNREEIETCKKHIVAEVQCLQPRLILPVGRLAIGEVLGKSIFPSNAKLNDVIGRSFKHSYFDREVDVIPLPHPSGLSSWHKTEPGRTLLKKAVKLITQHDVWKKEIE
jgi:uracil-DNA glycosylase